MFFAINHKLLALIHVKEAPYKTNFQSIIGIFEKIMGGAT